MLRIFFAVIFIFGLIYVAPFSSYAEIKETVGYVESTRIFPGNLSLRAKIDTGAKTSSLNAPNMTFFYQGTRQWVEFDIVNQKGKKIRMEKEIIRTAEIKRKGVLSFSTQKRPVIMLGICLGSVYKEVEVTLVDRSHFNYQLLIGRNFLTGSFLVDPSLAFSTKSNCKGVSKQ